MRFTRAVAAAAALTLMLPSGSHAQNGRGFRDSWFWGVKTGGIGYAKLSADPTTPRRSYGQAPMIGAEWLITRTHGALYTSVSQGFFSQQTFIPSSAAATDTTVRAVDVKNARRVDIAIMAFPGTHLNFHPYVGAGFSLQSVGSLTPTGTFETSDDLAFANEVLQDSKTAVSPVFIVGGQKRYTRMSAFGQLTVSPSNRAWILYNGSPMTFSYEIGVRYNFGSSIAR